MILDAVTLRNVGLFTEAVTVGPFSRGLNVLAANNEEGKSTIVRALVRGLFDRHNTTAEEIRQLQPAGTSLSPEITVDFQTDDGAYRIHKQFLSNTPRSILYTKRSQEWQRIAEADEADRQVRNMLNGDKAAKGATKPEHWGLLSYLWGRQGQPVAWPSWKDQTGEIIQNRLARVQIDALVDQLSERFGEQQQASFTPRGKPSKSGPLAQARGKVNDLTEKLETCRKQREELEAEEDRHRRLATKDIPVLGKQLSEKQQALQTLRQQHETVNNVKKEIQQLATDVEKAEKALQQVREDETRLRTIEKECGELESQRQQIAGQRQNQQKLKSQFQQNVQEAEKTESEIRRSIPEATKARDRLNALVKLNNLREEVDNRQRQLNRIDTAQQSLDALKTERAKLPDIKQQTLNALKKMDQEINRLQTKLETVGIHLEITPDHDGEISVSADSGDETIQVDARQPRSLSAARQLALTLKDWGRLRISSGAEELQTLEADLNQKTNKRNRKLDNLGVNDTREAESTHGKIKDIDAQIQQREKSLQDYLAEGETRDALASRITALNSEIKNIQSKWKFTTEEENRPRPESETQRDSAENTLKDLNEKRDKALDNANAYRAQVQTAADSEQQLQEELSVCQNKLSSLKGNRDELQKRYPHGIEPIKTEAQEAFTKAEARHNSKSRELPADHDKIPQRLQQTEKAVEQLNEKLNALRTEEATLRGSLQSKGAGLYGRESELEEELDMARRTLEQTWSHATAARLLQGMLQHYKQKMVQSLLGPLEDELSAAFAELTDNDARRVFLNEDLQIAGIGSSRDAAVQFEQLSQGAREQLVLALRSAIAKELSRESPQILILDDVLVNTDPVRQQNVIDFLHELSRDVQCLILTCHANWYEGIGTALTIH